jgi:hypothetical protein
MPSCEGGTRVDGDVCYEVLSDRLVMTFTMRFFEWQVGDDIYDEVFE